MGMTYLDKEGNEQYPIMGCYGIGVGRLAASVCEVRHDDYGPIWPITIAPWQVHLCCLRADDAEAKALADKLYDEMQKDGIEVYLRRQKCAPGRYVLRRRPARLPGQSCCQPEKPCRGLLRGHDPHEEHQREGCR